MEDLFFDVDLMFSIYFLLILSFLFVFINAIFRLYREYKIYMNSGFYNITGYKFFNVLFSNRKIKQYDTFNMLEKVCINGHLLSGVELNSKNGNKEIIDTVMVDKYGISVFLLEENKGTIIGKEEDFYWKVKRGIFSKRTYNMVREAKRKIEVIKEYLKIHDSSVVNAYIVFDDSTKYNVRITNRHVRLVKSFYMKGVIAYEINNSRRVLSDNEVKAYTIMLEKNTKSSSHELAKKIDDISYVNKQNFIFEFKNNVSNYLDLKRIWSILCQCDKDYNPPLSWYRNDIDDFDEEQKQKLMPNVFYKHIIKYPFILVREKGNIVGFLSFESNKVISSLSELGRVNYVNAVCIDKKYLRNGLRKDLYKYLDERVPKEYKEYGIVTKAAQSDLNENVMLNELKYTKKAILRNEDENMNTLYYYKGIDK